MIKHNNIVPKMKILALLAREHGLAVLEELIKEKPRSLTIFTHQYEPKTHELRNEFIDYSRISHDKQIPLHTIDNVKEKGKLEIWASHHNYDLLVACSWHYHISPTVFNKAELAVNIHRGKLPEYAGAEPIKRAILDEKKSITITAHKIIDKIDGGKVLYEEHYPLRLLYTSIKDNYITRIDQDVAIIKKEITPLFTKITRRILDEV